MKTLWQMLISPEQKAEEETMLPSGIIIPALSDSYSLVFRENRHDSRPLQGTVVATPIHGCMVMYDDRSKFSKNGPHFIVDGGKQSYYENGRDYPMPAEARMQVPWRMPEVGDTVWFGYMSWVWERTEQFMWPDEIYWVEPKSGEPYAMGDWCIVEQIREDAVSKSGLVLSSNPGTQLGRGVVRAVGDGFAMEKPSIKPGMTVIFRVFGSKNPEVRNPFGGDNATRIRPSQVVAIDTDGISIQEIEDRRIAAEGIVSQTASLGFIEAIDDLDAEAGKLMAGEDIVKKQKRYEDVRYHGKRLNY